MEKLPRDITLKYLVAIANQKQQMVKTLRLRVSIGNITVGQPHPAVGPKTHKTQAHIPTTKTQA